MKKFSFIILAAIAFLSGVGTSCSDPDAVKDLVLDRVLSPTGISARVSQNLNIIVNWDRMGGATKYEVEGYMDAPNYDREPDYFHVASDTIDTLKNLVGETTYYIRVRAIDENNESRNSKWVEINRTTLAEQNMNSIKQADITANSVTVSWTPGIAVDKIIVAPTSSTSTASTTEYPLNDAEKAAGKATVTGLMAETSYRATLKYGDKTRGFATFKTAIDFSGGDVINLTPDGDWKSAIENAAAGSKIALAPGKYELTDAKLKINSSVTIGAKDPANMPVLNTCIQVIDGSALYLYQVVLDGEGTDGSQAINFVTDGASYGALNIDGCEVRNYTKGFYYINVAAAVASVTINNCVIHDIECNGGDMFDSRKGYIGQVNLTNSTIYNSAKSRDVFRMDDASATLGGAPVYVVTNNTFYNVGNGGANYRIFYVRYANNKITFTSNVVANFKNKRGFANSSATDNTPTLSNNLYYNTQNLLTLADGNTEAVLWFDESGTDIIDNPFTDADNFNFYLNSELLRSYAAGDPRWY